MIAYVENSARPETWARDTGRTFPASRSASYYRADVLSVTQ